MGIGALADFGPHCEDCPLRAQCTKSKSGRTISIHAEHKRIRRAREEAVDRARQMLWDSILREKVAVPAGGAAPEVTVEYLVVTNPAFESSLWAMIARLEPLRVEDRPNGDLVVQLETDRREALALATDYAARMRREGRL